ncbi:2-oxoacid:acceptor oxidoreductase family protein [Candidatus Contubernalis alkaliaceticus]|uniref:2-oxoacid:acceptor oxidoreductase family protein n=1 Tax=Candidatus Contubernalis alkaliaceticus TaxID=338645 RepID=UPI001F4C48E5|nr:2-oxoacid:acceptor oxidoreductase family protein [Candidatus Contubernalis alkalaceticus]UNC91022.1 2-oxoacid:acceptor oxidoreductase family protein [Candidatus Contubernalis alkalaceticus]
MQEIRIHGRGGQGVVTLGELLAKSAIKTGKEAQTLPFFGVERRGAAVKAAVRIDDTPIKVRSQSYNPDFLVILNENLLEIALDGGKANNAIIIVNAEQPLAVNMRQWIVSATSIAIENGQVIGGEPFVNVPMVGAICRVLGIPFEVLEATLSEQWSGAKLTPNIATAGQAYDTVREVQLEGGFKHG